MIYLLDTDVLSERTKGSPNAGVDDFLRRVPAETVRVSAMALAEIAQGVENNPSAALKTFLAEVLRLPVAAFGEDEALEWGRLKLLIGHWFFARPVLSAARVSALICNGVSSCWANSRR